MTSPEEENISCNLGLIMSPHPSNNPENNMVKVKEEQAVISPEEVYIPCSFGLMKTPHPSNIPEHNMVKVKEEEALGLEVDIPCSLGLMKSPHPSSSPGNNMVEVKEEEAIISPEEVYIPCSLGPTNPPHLSDSPENNIVKEEEALMSPEGIYIPCSIGPTNSPHLSDSPEDNIVKEEEALMRPDGIYIPCSLGPTNLPHPSNSPENNHQDDIVKKEAVEVEMVPCDALPSAYTQENKSPPSCAGQVTQHVERIFVRKDLSQELNNRHTSSPNIGIKLTKITRTTSSKTPQNKITSGEYSSATKKCVVIKRNTVKRKSEGAFSNASQNVGRVGFGISTDLKLKIQAKQALTAKTYSQQSSVTAFNSKTNKAQLVTILVPALIGGAASVKSVQYGVPVLTPPVAKRCCPPAPSSRPAPASAPVASIPIQAPTTPSTSNKAQPEYIIPRRTNTVLNKQAREMIYNVNRFMKKESEEGGSNLQQVLKRVAEATNTSVSTVRRIIKEGDNLTAFKTPGKERPYSKKPVTDVDNHDQGVIKRCIHNFHIAENELLTTEKLRKKLKNDINYQGSERSLRRIIKQLGFQRKRTQNNKQILLERTKIRLKRIEYLQQISKYRQEGRPIIFTGESYVDPSPSFPKAGSDDSCKGLKKPTSKGPRVVTVHAGSETGFVPNALLTFKAGVKTANMNNNVNYEVYEIWLCSQLVPNLPPNSVVVVGNEAYHNKQLDPAPTSDAKYSDMQGWLTAKGINHTKDMLKPQLFHLIKGHTDQHKNFKIDDILAENNHSVLRLPPYHPDLNPIELAWAAIKEYVSSKNVGMSVKAMTDLIEEKLELMGASDWNKLCQKVKEVEDQYRKSDHVVDMMTDKFIIRIDDDYDSESDDDDDGDDVSEDEDDEDDEAATT